MRELAVLQESTEMILSSMDVDTVLHQILLIVRNYFEATNCAVLLVDHSTHELYCRAQNGYPEQLTKDLRLKVGKDGISGWVAEHKMPLYVPDVAKEPRYILADASVRSELALPLLVRDEVIGVLSVSCDKLDFFSDDMIGLLALFAGQAAVAVENARLYSSERRRMRQIELINLIARSATAANDVEQLLSNLADLIEDTFDGTDVCMLLRDRDGRLVLRAYAGQHMDLPETFAASERSGIIAQAFSSRNNAVANDAATRPGWPVCFPGAASELCVPLVSFGETLGALVVSHDSPGFFGPEDRSIAQAAADVCATAIRNVQLSDEIRRITNIDALTGVYNQRFFHVLAAQEASRSRRYQKRFSLLMLELNGFHQGSSQVDHEQNDELLREIATQLKKQMRNVDSICRYGPQRFAVVLPETSAEQVPVIQKKLSDGFAELRTGRRHSDHVDVRFAWVSYPQDGANELDLVRMLVARISGEKAGAAAGE
jgi:diguanylate cyclase (GGDEF)-like protein